MSSFEQRVFRATIGTVALALILTVVFRVQVESAEDQLLEWRDSASPGLLLIALAFVFLTLLLAGRSERARARDRELPSPDAGVLVCDAVDEETLASVARQLKLEELPTRSEHKRTHGRKSFLSFPIRLLRLGRSSERTAEDTEFFEHTDDMNVLLGRVLRALNDRGALRRDLTRVPGLALATHRDPVDEKTIEHVLRSHFADWEMAEPSAQASAVANAIQAVDWEGVAERLNDALGQELAISRLAENLRERWRDINDRALVLVEGPWYVEPADAGLALRLAALTVDEGERHPEGTIAIPDGLAVECRVSRSMLLEHRAEQLKVGQRVTASVFGVVAPQAGGDGRTLILEPTAVFERLAAPN